MGTVDVLVGCGLVAVLTALVAVEGALVAHVVAHAVQHYAHLIGAESE